MAAAPNTSGGEIVPLRDGSEVLVRPIRADDKAALTDAFERLSDETRYQRFLSPLPELRPMDLVYLTEVDHHDHEALVAFGPDGAVVGVARYVRPAARPESAEFAITVADEWQRRGLGTALLKLLSTRARAEGVQRFSASVLAENHEMLGLLEKLGTFRVLRAEGAVVEVEGDLGVSSRT
jgi:RimJ/RimL family protein N-acetyltransferase